MEKRLTYKENELLTKLNWMNSKVYIFCSLGYSSILSDKTEKWKQVTEFKLLSAKMQHFCVKVFVAAGEMDWHDMEVIILHWSFLIGFNTID